MPEELQKALKSVAFAMQSGKKETSPQAIGGFFNEALEHALGCQGCERG